MPSGDEKVDDRGAPLKLPVPPDPASVTTLAVTTSTARILFESVKRTNGPGEKRGTPDTLAVAVSTAACAGAPRSAAAPTPSTIAPGGAWPARVPVAPPVAAVTRTRLLSVSITASRGPEVLLPPTPVHAMPRGPLKSTPAELKPKGESIHPATPAGASGEPASVVVMPLATRITRMRWPTDSVQ